MNLPTFILERRHAMLERQIEEERKRPVPDHLRLQALKRRKLFVKERLAALRTRRLAPA